MIHPSSIVSVGAEIGPDVEVGPFCVIEDDTVIGAGCRLGSHVTVMRHTRLGPGCEVHAGAVLGDTPQDKGFKGCLSYAEIGSGCIIREGVTIHRGTAEGSVTRVGDGCFLMAFSHIAHNAVLERDVILANAALLAGHVHVGERAFISGGSAVHQFARIGRLAMLGGGCMCSRDVPPFLLVAPNSWNGVEGMNIVGMRRAGMDTGERMEIRKIFRLIYRSGLNTAQALDMIDKINSPLAAEMAGFIRTSKRGICRGGDSSEDAD